MTCSRMCGQQTPATSFVFGLFSDMVSVSGLQLTAGSVRAKSAKSVCIKNVMDVMFGGVAYYLLGWAFAYGDKQECDADGVCSSVGNPFIGTEQFAMAGTPATSFHTFYFQYVVSVPLPAMTIFLPCACECPSCTCMQPAILKDTLLHVSLCTSAALATLPNLQRDLAQSALAHHCSSCNFDRP